MVSAMLFWYCYYRMVILDFSKAFDTAPHDHLLGTMEFYGIQGPLLKWTASFLKTRSQSVFVEGKYAKPAQVLSGVPQGTVLGPLLFLIHIDYLPTIASCIALCTAWQISLPCKLICWPWSTGAMHGACASMLGSARLCRYVEARALCIFTPSVSGFCMCKILVTWWIYCGWWHMSASLQWVHSGEVTHNGRGALWMAGVQWCMTKCQ